MSLTAYLLVGGALFTCGLFTVITRRNAIAALLGIELILNAAGINFVAFNYYQGGGKLDGQLFALFIITLAAVEAAIAFAIVVSVFRGHQQIQLDELDQLKR